MTIVIIGSTALNYHLPGFRAKPGDVDLLMTYETFKQWFGSQVNVESVYPIEGGKKFVVKFFDKPIHEIELIKPDSSAEAIANCCENRRHEANNREFANLANWTCRNQVGIIGEYLVPPFNLLYTIKMSHRYLKDSPFFLKTLEDLYRLKELGCTSDPFCDILRQREKETYVAKLPRLNQSKQDFFTGDSVNYIYDHDSLHLAVKIGEAPAYAAFKPPEKEVMVSKAMWDTLPYDIKINSVLEEAYVLALERSQIPHGDKITPHSSFKMALMKVCSSITSGWWREFAYNNYYVVLGRYSDDYVNKFKTALEAGVVKPFTGAKY